MPPRTARPGADSSQRSALEALKGALSRGQADTRRTTACRTAWCMWTSWRTRGSTAHRTLRFGMLESASVRCCNRRGSGELLLEGEEPLGSDRTAGPRMQMRSACKRWKRAWRPGEGCAQPQSPGGPVLGSGRAAEVLFALASARASLFSAFTPQLKWKSGRWVLSGSVAEAGADAKILSLRRSLGANSGSPGPKAKSPRGPNYVKEAFLWLSGLRPTSERFCLVLAALVLFWVAATLRTLSSGVTSVTQRKESSSFLSPV